MLLLAGVGSFAVAAPSCNAADLAGETGGTVMVSDQSSSAPAVIDSQSAGRFVQSMADEAIGYISDEVLDKAQKKEKLAGIFEHSFDIRTISRFTLGRYWRDLTAPQQEEYRKLYKDMIVAIYADRLSNYQGEMFTVTNVRQDSPSDFIVLSTIVPSTGDKIPVSWRLRAKDGQFRVIDVAIQNVSMIITQKADFASIIQSKGGNAAVILEYLRGRVDQKT